MDIQAAVLMASWRAVLRLAAVELHETCTVVAVADMDLNTSVVVVVDNL